MALPRSTALFVALAVAIPSVCAAAEPEQIVAEVRTSFMYGDAKVEVDKKDGEVRIRLSSNQQGDPVLSGIASIDLWQGLLAGRERLDKAPCEDQGAVLPNGDICLPEQEGYAVIVADGRTTNLVGNPCFDSEVYRFIGSTFAAALAQFGCPAGTTWKAVQACLTMRAGKNGKGATTPRLIPDLSDLP